MSKEIVSRLFALLLLLHLARINRDCSIVDSSGNIFAHKSVGAYWCANWMSRFTLFNWYRLYESRHRKSQCATDT